MTTIYDNDEDDGDIDDDHDNDNDNEDDVDDDDDDDTVPAPTNSEIQEWLWMLEHHQPQQQHARRIRRVARHRVRPRQRHIGGAHVEARDPHRRCSCRYARIAGTSASAPSSSG